MYRKKNREKQEEEVKISLEALGAVGKFTTTSLTDSFYQQPLTNFQAKHPRTLTDNFLSDNFCAENFLEEDES